MEMFEMCIYWNGFSPPSLQEKLFGGGLPLMYGNFHRWWPIKFIPILEKGASNLK